MTPKNNTDNIIVAFSNLIAILPITYSYIQEEYIITIATINILLWSFLSHLFESHKHGMNGFNCSAHYSDWLNRIDGISAFVLFFIYFAKIYSKMNYLIYKSEFWLILTEALFGGVYMLISEYDKYNRDRKHVYIQFHCMWHSIIYLSQFECLMLLHQ